MCSSPLPVDRFLVFVLWSLSLQKLILLFSSLQEYCNHFTTSKFAIIFKREPKNWIKLKVISQFLHVFFLIQILSNKVSMPYIFFFFYVSVVTVPYRTFLNSLLNIIPSVLNKWLQQEPVLPVPLFATPGWTVQRARRGTRGTESAMI